MLTSSDVSIVSRDTSGTYPSRAPFRPESDWPELSRHMSCDGEPSDIHQLLRIWFHTMGCDPTNHGSPDWNPMSRWIQPGQRVVIKPNLVRHFHDGGGDFRAVVTHGSVVRAIADYVALALQGDGHIVIGDAPVQGTDFDTVVAKTGLREVCDDVAACWGIPVRLADFRLWALETSGHEWSEVGHSLPGDVDGYCAARLDGQSMLTPLDDHSERFRVTCYDPVQMKQHHNSGRHEYLITKAVLDADVVVNVPKLKTHRKVGLTAAMKNLVGINGHKDWLPHHRCGSVSEGGDEYQEASRLKRMHTWLDEGVYCHPGSLANTFRRLGGRIVRRLNRYLSNDQFYEGSWYGNDTCWRMVLDLNRVLFYADREGHMTDEIQRTTLTIVDAIIAGEGDGPMAPDARHCNLLVGGENPAAVDAVLATLIGFDYRKLQLVANGFSDCRWPLADFEPDMIDVRSNVERFAKLRVGQPYDGFRFQPPSPWKGHVELPDASQTAMSHCGENGES